jgi:hypothetical protein
MGTLVERRGFVWYATISVVVALGLEAGVYFGVVRLADDARPIWSEFINWHGGVVAWVLILAAAVHAWGLNRKKWAVLMLFVWPLAFVYALLAESQWVNE